MSEVERFAASVFERFAPELLDRPVGVPTWRNGEDDSGLTVDWTYDAAHPPIALEVTGCHTAGMRQTIHELGKKLEPALGDLVERDGLGEWLVVVDADSNVKQLLSELRDLILQGRSIRVGEYTSQDLQMEDPLATGSLHRRLSSLGLVELSQKGRWGSGVECIVTGGGPDVVGFTDRLIEALDENRRKLQIEGYESHLAVVIFDFQMSVIPEVTAPPDLGPGIDYLWVIHTWPGASGVAETWVVPPDIREWHRRMWASSS